MTVKILLILRLTHVFSIKKFLFQAHSNYSPWAKIQAKKSFTPTNSNTIGIKLWLAPQISEHWPYANPGRYLINLVWFKRPGTASIFTPKDGTAHEWRTSELVIKTRTCVKKGRAGRLSVSKRRKPPSLSSFVGTI